MGLFARGLQDAEGDVARAARDVEVTPGPVLRRLSCATSASFQKRWSPADITSFITSYLAATEWKTASTCSCFRAVGTVRKPKCVVSSGVDEGSGLAKVVSSNSRVAFKAQGPYMRRRQCATTAMSRRHVFVKERECPNFPKSRPCGAACSR